MTSNKWQNRYEDEPPTLIRRQPSDAALAAASRTIYCIPARNVVGIWAYEFTVADGDAETVAGNLIHELAIQFDAFAAYWSDDGAGEDCWKCKGEGKLHGQHDDEEA